MLSISKELPSNRLLIEKLSFWGRKKYQSVPLNDLISGGSIFNTWKSNQTGEGYLLQFIPKDEVNRKLDNTDGNPVNQGNVSSYKGEAVDLEEMNKIYSEISCKRWQDKFNKLPMIWLVEYHVYTILPI